MGLKAALSKPFAAHVVRKLDKWRSDGVAAQEAVFQHLVQTGKGTQFGAEHFFDRIHTYSDFRKNVPLRTYEDFEPYVERIMQGEKDVLWKGRPLYWSKTSGTTSGVKYIPISKESIHNHLDSARNALLCYVHETGNTGFIDGKMIFLQGSPTLSKQGGIDTGRLSGIVAHHVPGYLQRNRMPSFATNCMEDWEEKVSAVVKETLPQPMSLISGIPSWVQMYFERLIEVSGKANVGEVFPDFSLFVYGGVNFDPYRSIFDRLIGRPVDTIETYPASEGFIAFQDSQKEDGLLLTAKAGIFYEFVPADEIGKTNPTRLSLSEVELGVNYAIVLNTNAGLWGYVIGDTVRFVSKDPYRLKVTGRTKHFISAFGEHVIGEEVDRAMRKVQEQFGGRVREFHVAPQVTPEEGNLPFHEWLVEFEQLPQDLDAFSAALDREMVDQNIYYKDLIDGNILRPLKLSLIQQEGFVQMMKSRGKLGGQNKVPRLANDRSVADVLLQWAKS